MTKFVGYNPTTSDWANHGTKGNPSDPTVITDGLCEKFTCGASFYLLDKILEGNEILNKQKVHTVTTYELNDLLCNED